MSRAVVIGTNAYPYLLRYWYELFTRVWESEVDKVYIAVSIPEHRSSFSYIKSILESHLKIRVIETNNSWPESINEVTKTITEDYILCMHDDTFVFKKGVINRYFEIVEKTGKIVTPLTYIFTPKDLVQELMHVNYPHQVPFNVEGSDEIGYSFYCNFFFMPKELYEKTSRDFGAWTVDPGEYCRLLNWTPISTRFNSDTNFLLCLELLKAGAIFYGIPKSEIAYIISLDDPVSELKRMRREKEGVFSGMGWIHLQTLAYHIYGLYFDVGEKEEIERSRGGKIEPKMMNDKASFHIPSFKTSLSIKLAWIKEFMSIEDYSGMSAYHKHAQKRIDEIIEMVPLNRKMIDELQVIFHKMIWKK